MLKVTTIQLGDPVILLIFMESADRLIHGYLALFTPLQAEAALPVMLTLAPPGSCEFNVS